MATAVLASPLLLRLPRGARLDDSAFLAVCRLNPDLRLELDREGSLIIMPPTLPETGAQNLEIGRQLGNWVARTGNGRAFDSSAGFQMPITGSTFSPDASWVPTERVALTTSSTGSGFPALCPDFVLELRSRSDALGPPLAKMEEYRSNGCSLGWLVDPVERRVHVFRAAGPAEALVEPATVSGDPVLPGFTLALVRVWG